MTNRGRSANTTESHEDTKSRRRRTIDDSAGVEVVTEDRVVQEREVLVHERQRAVEQVLDQHDTLVREVFHLEKFVSLLAYDPKVAKTDNSAVFQDFKSRFDLISQSTGAGPSRTTRRAHHDRLDALKASASSSVSAPPALRDNRKPKKIPKPKADPSPTFWSIVEETKGKAKPGSPERHHTSVSNGLSRHGKGKQKVNNASPPDVPSGFGEDPMGATDISASSIHSNQKRLPAIPNPSRADPSLEASPRKKRKIAILESDRPPDAAASSSTFSATPPMIKSKPIPSLPKHPPSRPLRMRSSHPEISNVPESPSSNDLHQSPALVPIKPPSVIRRVKLIVRRPPPSFSNPRQRPPGPQYGESLTSLLSSYVVHDSQELPATPFPEEIEQSARSQAAFWNRVDSLKRAGKLFYIPGADDLDPSVQQGDDIRKDPDIWDYLVDEVVTNGKTRARFPSGAQIAGQIASRVKAYWEGVSVKEDKMRLQEEQKKKVMARKLARDVTAAWSRALAHIRHEARLAYEAEERRRGHEHLDDILKNAGKILEAQQVDLFRGETATPSTSRTSSVSREDPHDDDEEDQVSDAATERASDVEDNDEFDTTALLGDVVTPSRENTVTSVDEPRPLPMDVDTPSTVPNEQLGQDVAPPLSRGHSPARSPVHTPTFLDDHNQSSLRQASPPTSRHRTVSPVVGGVGTVSDGPDAVDIGVQDPATIGDKNDVEVPMVADSGVFLSSPASEEREAASKPAEESNIVPNGDVIPGSEPEGSGSAVALPPSGTVDATDAHDVPMDDDDEVDSSIPAYLRPYAVTPVDWDPQSKVKPPPLLRGTLRPYQHAGLEWLASIHGSNLNGILADEMGLGKTIQTIALLAHLACDRGIWGPHLIIVPTSVLLNWEMEFKKFLPGFKVLSYHGNTKRRKELRQGWNNKYHFNVCVTSYTLASRDAHVFKRKPWYYMILDEAHMIKNFKSQRWNILLMFRSFRRLLLTGTPLQNNLTELWALLQFLMSGTNFANLKEFGDWFSNPLEKAIELGTALDDENQQRVSKLHTVLRPYLLRRLKKDVEKELPSKFEHLVMCPLSKRQRYLYDEFMARAETRHDLQSGVYQKIANILMQLRKVVNHPDLFEVRPIRTSFAMQRSAIADYEIKELLVRRRLLQDDDEHINLGFRGFRFIDTVNTPQIVAQESRRLDGTKNLPFTSDIPEEPPPYDVRTIDGYRKHRAYQQCVATHRRWTQIAELNRIRCSPSDVLLSAEAINIARRLHEPLLPLSALNMSRRYWTTAKSLHAAIKPYSQRAADMAPYIDTFTFATPPVVALDLPRIALRGPEAPLLAKALDPDFDAIFHRPSVKLQIAFPDASLLQYDCGKLQRLAELLRERKAGGHRVLIFTQMTRILDILEIFLNLHGYLYLRLDGATKIEDRQYITERFNCDPRVFCFISSSRSGGVGINLTGADTVVFYDSDFNPQMDRQCEDRAHRIGQIRDVHIYRFISQHTVEEALLRKANQKRNLDDIVIQKGEFDWRSLVVQDEVALTKALGEFEDTEDAHAAAIAAREAAETEGADEADFGWEGGASNTPEVAAPSHADSPQPAVEPTQASTREVEDEEEEEDEGGSVADYMIAFIRSDMEFFSEWR